MNKRIGNHPSTEWEKKVVSPQRVFESIDSGMCIFVGTGISEPKTLLKSLIRSESMEYRDLDLIQLISQGEAVSRKSLRSQKYRLKTFHSSGPASSSVSSGKIDLIPSRFSRIPHLIESGRITIDAAFVQITSPNEAGFSNLGATVDVARQVISKASLVVGEINDRIPRTFGDTFVPISEFDMLIRSDEPPMYIHRPIIDDITDRLAFMVASLIEDRSCLVFLPCGLHESLACHLVGRRDLGIHSPYFTDAAMDLINGGAVTNRYKQNCRGKSLTSYAMGTPELMTWLDRNPLVEFKGISAVYDPMEIGQNNRVMVVVPAGRVDLSGRVVLGADRNNMSFGPEATVDLMYGAELSEGGKTIFALPSRDRNGRPNIRITVEKLSRLFALRETTDTVVTEYGVASLGGRTVRERAQALIDIAHPEDRLGLVEAAKKKGILYPDQIFLSECAHLYPADIASKQLFKNDVSVRFRAIKPSDEEGMRRLFYRFSEEAVYYRYFSPISNMPHEKMQAYVNADCNKAVSIVGLVGEPGQGQIIAEARLVKLDDRPYADVAFVVDEKFQGMGIGTYLYNMLIRLAKERGLQGLSADVLPSNRSMMKVLEKGEIPITAKVVNGIYQLTMPFETRTGSGA